MANWLEATTWDARRARPGSRVRPRCPTSGSSTRKALPVLQPAGGAPARLRLRHERHSRRRRAARSGCKNSSDWSRGARSTTGPSRGPASASIRFRCVHGVFFARRSWPWQPKIARAVTSFIEASGVKPGGQRRRQAGRRDQRGQGRRHRRGLRHRPAPPGRVHRREDHRLLHRGPRAVPLVRASEPATALLEALADFEIATLLDRGLRLRTRCDLVRARRCEGERPDAAEAAARIAKFAADCADELGPVTEVTWSDARPGGK